MYPVLFEVFGYPISTFGLMMAVGFLVSAWIVGKRLAEYGEDPELASTILIYAMVGGVLGSKLYFAVDQWALGSMPFMDALLNRAGITWYGGLIGGTLAVTIGTRIHGISTLMISNCVSSAALIGQAFGRVGCFLVGDDYGRPTDGWWGVAFPEGAPPTMVPVHPTQLYEVVWLVFAGALLWRRRKTSPFIFGEYLMANGFGRFFIEMLRINPKVALGLTEPQWIGVALVVLGAGGWVYYRSQTSEAPV
ncbi:MAG: prolipoprotein diacylglyceryl transferase [bacterium]|nr:prolipoprotein diacylglyceryl transferase [bacterium]